MIRMRLSDLSGPFKRHVLEGLVDREWLSGGMSPKKAGTRTHDTGCTCDNCDGRGLHRHKDREVFIFLAGKGVVEVDGKDVPAAAGDIVIIEPGEDHHVRADEHCINLWLHGACAP